MTGGIEVTSQSLTTAQAKTMLIEYKWTIQALEKEGKPQPVPEQVKGLTRVFLKDGLTYSFLPSSNEEDAIPYEWIIDAGRITFYKLNKTETYEYKLVNNNGYELYLDMMGNDTMPTFVFKRAEKNEGLTMLQMVLIGDQVWTDRNINIDKFRNGDPIVESKSAAQWEAFGKKGQPSWCYANFDPDNKDVYGKLYNYYAVIDPRGLAPKGWHIPSEADLKQLIDVAGGVEYVNETLKSRYYWNDNQQGTNSLGFNGMPGGNIAFNGDFYYFGSQCDIWSSTQTTDDIKPKGVYLNLDTSTTKHKLYISEFEYGRSVRLIKD